MNNNVLAEKLNKIMVKLSEISALKAMTQGLMATMPLTLGTFLIAIIAAFPVDSWQNWLVESGTINDLQAVAGGTTEILAIFLVPCIAYKYATLKDKDGMSAVVMALGFYLILIPQKIVVTDNIINAFQKDYLGSLGVFIGIIVALVVSKLYCWLTDKGLVLKLPDSIPTYVSQSFSTVFISMIIFAFALIIRIAFSLSSYGNIFNFFQTFITAPFMGVGNSTVVIIGLACLANLVWCFGIHPATLVTIQMPIFATSIAGNIAAFQQGDPLPYITFAVLTFGFLTIGGQGGTLGLSINMLLFSKSDRYKALSKISIIPSIFNINEPLIFGAPIIMNPIYIVPMVLSSAVSGIIGVVAIKLGFFNAMNPLVMLPNVIPTPIAIFASSGIIAALGVVVAILALTVLYYPFFKYADKMELKVEKQIKAERE